MKALVGYTGFVGSNIYSSGHFDGAYDINNIKEAYNTNPELLIYAGLPAEKYLANNAPKKDMELILEAEKNISLINPKKIVLISTIDVFKTPIDVNENTVIDTEKLHPYGYNRYMLECWVRENYPDALIVRLPALLKDQDLEKYYELQDNGFYKIKNLTVSEKEILKNKFQNLGFSALNFTDSRNIYQFYPLKRLWNDIQIALKNNIKLWHPATEPILTEELYKYLTGKNFTNEISEIPIKYNYKTIYDKLFKGENGYICNKNEILSEIKEFVKNI